ncbi:PAS domain-containing sensor histidine kinase [Stieleria sp. JC731]|uniref:sensor histidine kinase n=1 Tax=Pirellulaceae TaxID=2691357 RepID=UPI001E42C01D|nr:PAS domain-containing sensor histidine kinase [Stieleria sp. JC731]MCC9601682.1 PAS domain-containing sensor histidine kinase [Stieleria sp. JC731]
MGKRDQFVIDAELCPVPILLISDDGVIQKTNVRLDELFGYDRDELRGQKVEVLVPTEVRRYHKDLRNAYFEIPTSRKMGSGRDLYGVRKDGTLLPVEIGLDHLVIDDQQMVLASVLDIRERKKSEAFIRRALNAASSAMIQVNEQGIIELANVRAGTMFGYEAEELLGKSIELLVPSRYRRKHPVYRTSYLAQHSTRGMGFGRELYGLRCDGSEFPIEITLTPIHETGGRSTMATVNDITDRKAREAGIEEQNEQLARLNQELAHFAYSASHDLKAPLTSIQGLLNFCIVDLEEEAIEEVRSNLIKCTELATTLTTRIEDTLRLAKSDMTPADFDEIDVEEHLQIIWAGLNAEDVELQTFLAHKHPITTVPARFDVILQNLLSNAIKFQKKLHSEKIVQVITASEPSGFHLTVADNGIGIAEQHRERVFEPFERVADSDIPGSGLGLAIAKKNVIQLQGSIEVCSAEGMTIFTVILPQSNASPASDPHSTNRVK